LGWKQGLLAAAVALGVAAVAAPARADALADIQSRGKILIAIDLGNPPFSVSNANHEPEGADVDVARLMAKDLGVDIEWVPVTGPNRVPFLQTGKADVVISSFSYTPERARTVMFSNPYGALKLDVWAPKPMMIKVMADLKGKRIGVTRGNIQDTDVTALAPEGTTIVRFDNDSTVAAALIAGQVDAMAGADHLEAAVAARNPDKQLESKFVIRNSYYSIGMRLGEFNLLHWVNTWIDFHKNNGNLAVIYKKWMGSDLPPLSTF
jgi:polar amino acid transport system substrate-binding protein